MKVRISAEEIQARTKELGQKISQDYEGKVIDVVGVLKGCYLFMADLVREITVPMTCDFLRVSSYGSGKVSSGEVRLDFDVTQPIEGKHVLFVEDIVDSGLTMRYLLNSFKSRNPASLKVCTLLHKPENQKVEVPIDYLGFSIPNEFVVGYGMDYAGRYRNLPYIGIMDKEDEEFKGSQRLPHQPDSTREH